MRMCLQSTNAYGKTNVWDLYDTNSFKIGLLSSCTVFFRGIAESTAWETTPC